MDFVARLFASLLVGLIQAYLMAIEGRKAFAANYGSESYYEGIYYAVFVICGELVYYALVWIFNWRVKRYDVFSPFVLFVAGMSNGNRLMTLLTFFSAISPSMLK